MLAAGTVPPQVQITGTPSRLCDVRIRTPNVGGPRGTAQFDWSIDGGLTWSGGVLGQSNVLTAASVPLGSTGLTALFDGTNPYNTDNTWRSTVKDWFDSSPNGFLFTETVGPANQPVISLTGMGGRPELLFDGVNNRLRCFDAAFATALLGGEDTPFTVGMVARCVGAVSGNHPLFSISYAVPTPQTAQASVRVLSSQYAAIKRGDSDASDTQSGGTPDNSPHRIIYRHNGTTVDVFVDNVAVISGAPQNRASCTVEAVTLGALLSIANVHGNVGISTVVTYAGARSVVEIGYLDQWLKNDYGL